VIERLATAALVGVPVERIVAGDEVERELWWKVTARAVELHNKMMASK
jgi:hypothetical protein